MASGGADVPAPRLPDVEELVDEIVARKGPAKYTDGLSEDTWEEVSCRGVMYYTGVSIGHSQQEENMRRIQSVGGVITSGTYCSKKVT